MKKGFKGITVLIVLCMLFVTACKTGGSGGETKPPQGTDSFADSKETENTQDSDAKSAEIQVFIAASLNDAITEIAEKYSAKHPDIKISINADSSGTLLTQIEEGFECDIFFSAAQKQMDALTEDGLVVENTRANVVNNQVCVVTYKGSGTKVTGLKDIGNASSIALADGSVPVGKYTRQAMVNSGLLEKTDDVSAVTTDEVSKALGGVEISEQSNVSKVRTAVIEGSCEVGTVYYSDTYGYENDLEILEKVSYDLTGNVIYPVCRVKNDEADADQTAAADDFYRFILSDEAKAVFDKYLFDTDVER